MLAQKTHAPNLIILFEAGSMAPSLKTAHLVAGPHTQTHALAQQHGRHYGSLLRGMVDYTFLGGANRPPRQSQLDRLAATTHAHRAPPGSGGASDLAALCWKTVTIMPHNRRNLSRRSISSPRRAI